jgi:membrane peptidoglycan carboxypeptidase
MKLPWRRLRIPILLGGAASVTLGILLLIWASGHVAEVFEARERETTSRLLGRPYPLAPGVSGSPEELARRLERLGYARVRRSISEPGTYAVSPGTVRVHLRAFRDPAGDHQAQRVRVSFARGRIAWVDRPGGFLEPSTIALFHGEEMEERDLVEVSDCPEHLIAAILAAEDRRFYLHPGIDPRGIARAIRANFASGSIAQGGSTLTQQLAKNLFFSGRRSFGRKASEAVAALILEARYSKERILRAYINEIYLGQRGPASIRGVGRAARHYFGRHVSELTLGESALLAGMTRAPGRYNPILHPERARERRRLVLQAMERAGSITEEERFAAEREPLPPRRSDGIAPNRYGAYVAALVRQELEAAHGVEFRRRDLGVHTSIDPLYQEAAEAAVREGLERLEIRYPRLRRGEDAEPLQVALVSIDLRDGGIVALVGGRGFAASQFNRATSARRQPGSLFKPIVYLAGLTHPGNSDGRDEERRRAPRPRWEDGEDLVSIPLDEARAQQVAAVRRTPDRDRVVPAARRSRRWPWSSRSRDRREEDPHDEEEERPSVPMTAATILLDEPYEVRSGGKIWAPRNHDHRFRGPVTVQRALEESLNVPTARAAAAIGLDRIVEVGHALGIESPLPEVPSLALGTANLTPLEMATAFATIASNGIRRSPFLLRGVTDKGRTLDKAGFGGSTRGAPGDAAPDPRSRPGRWDRDGRSLQVVPRSAAVAMTALLGGVTYRGTARSIRSLGFSGVAAGKTGTSDGGRDLWFCGFTPQILTLVWVGFDDNTPTRLSGARGALPIWVDYMERIGAETDLPFRGEEDLIWLPIDPSTGALARRSCPEARWAPFVSGTEPRERCRRHGFFRRWWRD